MFDNGRGATMCSLLSVVQRMDGIQGCVNQSGRQGDGMEVPEFCTCKLVHLQRI